jgi:hypothetical protein
VNGSDGVKGKNDRVDENKDDEYDSNIIDNED